MANYSTVEELWYASVVRIFFVLRIVHNRICVVTANAEQGIVVRRETAAVSLRLIDGVVKKMLESQLRHEMPIRELISLPPVPRARCLALVDIHHSVTTSTR